MGPSRKEHLNHLTNTLTIVHFAVWGLRSEQSRVQVWGTACTRPRDLSSWRCGCFLEATRPIIGKKSAPPGLHVDRRPLPAFRRGRNADLGATPPMDPGPLDFGKPASDKIEIADMIPPVLKPTLPQQWFAAKSGTGGIRNPPLKMRPNTPLISDATDVAR